MFRLGFESEQLTDAQVAELNKLRTQCATDILTMTTLAGCGHPGGSMSSLDFLLLLYAGCKVSGAEPLADDRDRIFISHGHISPGTYSVLSAYGFCDRDEMLVTFRRPHLAPRAGEFQDACHTKCMRISTQCLMTR